MSFYSFIFLGKFLPSLPSLSQQWTDTMEETTDSSFLSFTDMTGRLTGRCHNYVLASQQTSVSLSRWAAVLTLHQHIIVDALYFSPILLSAEWIQSRLPLYYWKRSWYYITGSRMLGFQSSHIRRERRRLTFEDFFLINYSLYPHLHLFISCPVGCRDVCVVKKSIRSVAFYACWLHSHLKWHTFELVLPLLASSVNRWERHAAHMQQEWTI